MKVLPSDSYEMRSQNLLLEEYHSDQTKRLYEIKAVDKRFFYISFKIEKAINVYLLEAQFTKWNIYNITKTESCKIAEIYGYKHDLDCALLMAIGLVFSFEEANCGYWPDVLKMALASKDKKAYGE